MGYNGTQIIKALKDQAYKLGLATILRAFCCGIAAFMTNPKYADVPGSHMNNASRLQWQDSTMEDIESARSCEGLRDSGMPASDRRDDSDRLEIMQLDTDLTRWYIDGSRIVVGIQDYSFLKKDCTFSDEGK